MTGTKHAASSKHCSPNVAHAMRSSQGAWAAPHVPGSAASMLAAHWRHAARRDNGGRDAGSGHSDVALGSSAATNRIKRSGADLTAAADLVVRVGAAGTGVASGARAGAAEIWICRFSAESRILLEIGRFSCPHRQPTSAHAAAPCQCQPCCRAVRPQAPGIVCGAATGSERCGRGTLCQGSWESRSVCSTPAST